MPTLGLRLKPIPDPEPTLTKSLLPELPDTTWGLDVSQA